MQKDMTRRTNQAKKGSSEGTGAIGIKIGQLLIGLIIVGILIIFLSNWGAAIYDIFKNNPLIKAAITVRDVIMK